MKKKNWLFYLLLSITYIGLPALILLNIINFDYKFYALTIGGFFVFLLLYFNGYSQKEMGLKFDSLKQSFIDTLLLTLILLIIGIILFLTGKSQRFDINESGMFFIFYIFISCPIQEFLYRGALNAIFEKLELKPPFIILISSLLYSYVHIIYLDFLTLILTFAIGLIWHYEYRKTNNLFGVTVSHIVLGILTILIGLIN